MNLSRPFIERPVATTLLMIAVVLCGLLAYTLLPVAALPEVAFPTIEVVTQYPGASPDTMSAIVTAPLERRLGQMPGLQQMNSTSSDGFSVITLQFDLSLSLDVAEQEVQQAINAASKLLPADLPAPPNYNKINPADAPILTLALHSDVLPLTEVQDIAETRLVQKLSQISGVGLVSIEGGQRKAIVVEAKALLLAGTNRSLEAVRSAITAGNQMLPKGSLVVKSQSYAINGNDQLSSLSDYRNLIVGSANGRVLPMWAVARVSNGPENSRQAAWSNGVQIIELDIHRQSGANVIEVAERVLGLLPTLRASLPPTIRLEILADRTHTIRASVHDVQVELISAVVLVVMVVFLFLRNLAATIIPAVSVPITLIGTLALAYTMGFSLNNLTLMALTIATGFVVDDAIVVVENIIRYTERGENSIAAAVKGARQIGFTIISLSLSLIAVMIPLLFMSGIVGRLFREFAMTLSIAVVVSALVSLTLTPMMCAYLLKPPKSDEGQRTVDWLDRLQNTYGDLLDRVLNQPALMLASVILIAMLSVVVLFVMPKGLFPTQDTGLLLGVSEASPTVSFDAMRQVQERLVSRLRRDPAISQVSSYVGVDAANATLNTGRLLIQLKPAEQREKGGEVIARLLRESANEADIKLYLQPVQDLTLDTQASATAFRLGVQATTPAALATAHEKLIHTLRQDPVFSEVFSQMSQVGQQITLNFNRATAARLGVTQQKMSDALYDAFGERQISTIYSQLNQYHVILKSAEPPTDIAHFLEGVYVRTASGQVASLGAMVSPSVEPAQLSLNRKNQFPYADVSFNVAKGQSLDVALRHLATAENAAGLSPAVTLALEGSARAYQASLQTGGLLVLAAIIVVYILMGVLYESFIHPLTILSTLPAAALGALLALWFFNMQFDVIALIGIVLLVGIVMKNAIMMIDFALELERREGMLPAAAINAAARLRFRPILMTTVASFAGALPLAFGTGIGAELRHPLGIAIIGGLIVSQLLTLFSTPVIYIVLHRASTKLSHWARVNNAVPKA